MSSLSGGEKDSLLRLMTDAGWMECNLSISIHIGATHGIDMIDHDHKA